MKSINELENVILDQIEKLNDDSIFEDADKAQVLVDRSRAMSELAGKVCEINRLKLDAVKEMYKNGGLYGEYLGIEEKPGKKKSI